MKKRCTRCRSTDSREETFAYVRRIDGTTFKADVAAERCVACGEVLVSGPGLLAAERALTARLARSTVGPQGFRWLRRAAGLQAVQLAALLDVSPGTVSRWENGKKPLERRAAALVAALALEAAGESANTRELLSHLARGRKPPRRVHLGPQPATGS
jgi:DNA-binding transcriptional regulator YiaG